MGFVSVGPTRDDDADAATGEIYAIYVAPDRLGDSRAIDFYEAAGWRSDGVHSSHGVGGLSLPSVRYRATLV